MTIDELAREADVPGRTIREYQTMKVLPPPVRVGRVGVYDAGHLQRLASSPACRNVATRSPGSAICSTRSTVAAISSMSSPTLRPGSSKRLRSASTMTASPLS